MKKLSVKNVAVVLVMSFFVVLIAWILTRPDIIRLNKETLAQPDFVFERPIIIYTKKGEKRSRIEAVRGELYKDKKAAYLYEINTTIYRGKDKPVILRAAEGKVDINTQKTSFIKCYLEQPGPEGLKMSADFLEWFPDDNLLKGSGNVKLWGKDIDIKTDEIAVNFKDNTFTLTRRPLAEISIRQK